MPENSLSTGTRPTTSPTSDDTLFGSLQRARERVASGASRAGRPAQRRRVGGAHLRRADDRHRVGQRAPPGTGPGEGDVLCLQLPNWTEAVIYTYAASRLGAVVCPITTIYRQTRAELHPGAHRVQGPGGAGRLPRFRLRRDGARAGRRPSGPPARDLRRRRPRRRVSCRAADHLDARDDGAVPPPPVDIDQMAVLAFTSGTTGESKGVMHSHRSMHAAIDDFVAHAGFGDGLTSLVMSPFGHLTGFTWGVLMPLRGAGDVVLLETWDPASGDRADHALLRELHHGRHALPERPARRGRTTGTLRFPEVFVCAGAPIPPSPDRAGLRRRTTRGWSPDGG